MENAPAAHPKQMGGIPRFCLTFEAPGSRGVHSDPHLRGSEPAAAPKGRCAAVRITAGTGRSVDRRASPIRAGADQCTDLGRYWPVCINLESRQP